MLCPARTDRRAGDGGGRCANQFPAVCYRDNSVTLRNRTNKLGILNIVKYKAKLRGCFIQASCSTEPAAVAPLAFFPRDQGRDEVKGGDSCPAVITGIRETFIRVAEMKYAPTSYARGLYDMYPRGPLHKLKCNLIAKLRR